MTLDQTIKMYQDNINCNVHSCDFCSTDYDNILKWLKELQKSRKLNNQKKWKIYTICYWCNSPYIYHNYDIKAKCIDDAIERYKKLYPKMHPVTAYLKENK